MVEHGQIIAAEYGDRMVHGLICCQVYQTDVWLLMSKEGKFYYVYYAGCYEPGQKDVWGRERFTEDPDEIRRETKELRKKPSIARIIRILSRTDATIATPGRGVFSAWEIPTKLCINNSSELSPRFTYYLDAHPLRRKKMDRALDVLRKRAPKQYKVVMSCYFGDIPQIWIAHAWGTSRQSINWHYKHGVHFIEQWVGTDEEAL